MGKLSSRFMREQSDGIFHSTDIVKPSTNIGSTSTESYEKRREIEANRQHVAGYRNAQVLHSYRQVAQEGAIKGSTALERPRTSRIEHRSTSRIEHAPTSRRGADTSTVAPRAVQAPEAFREPRSRGYSPYT